MAINVDYVETPETGQGETPGPIGATWAHMTQSSAIRPGGRPPVPPVVHLKDVREELRGGGDIPGGGTLPGGGGDG